MWPVILLKRGPTAASAAESARITVDTTTRSPVATALGRRLSHDNDRSAAPHRTTATAPRCPCPPGLTARQEPTGELKPECARGGHAQ